MNENIEIKIERKGNRFELWFYVPEFGWVINRGKSEETNGGDRYFFHEVELPSMMDHAEIPESIDGFIQGWAQGKGWAGATCETQF